MATAVHRVVLMLLFFKAAEAFRWTSDLQEGGHLVACVGGDVTFPWAYVTETGENVIAQFWFRNMTGSFASYFAQQFVTSSTRVTHGGQAEITLHNVSREDDDTYGVSVKLYGRREPLTQRVSLSVAEPPRTTDDLIHVTEDSQSSTDTGNTSRRRLRLKCGEFRSLGFPNVSVVWTDPSGRRLPSTSFDVGNFYLDLDPHHARGGNYTCSLQHEARATQCLYSDSPLLAAAIYHLNTMETKLSGLDSQVLVLHNFSTEHDTRLSALQEQVSDHSSQILDLQKHDSQQDSQIADLQRESTSMNSLITDLQKQTTDQTSQISDLRKENTGLKKKVSDLQQETKDQSSQISDLQTQNAELQTQLSEQSTAIASLNKIVSQLQQAQDNQVAGLRDNITQLDTRLSGQQDKLSQLDTQLSGQQTQLSNHSTQISDLNSRVTSQTEVEERSLQNDITQCQSDVRELRTELGTVKALAGQLDKKVAFHAFYDEEAVTLREPIRFKLVGQISGGYDASKGIFTAPHSGWYSFQVQLFPHTSADQDIWFDLVQNEDVVARGVGYQRAEGSFTCFTAITVHVLAGDRIWVRSYYAQPYWRASFDNFFSGVLVMADN